MTYSLHHHRQLSDSLTPVQAYLLLRDEGPASCLFESTDYHSREYAHSVVAFDPLGALTLNRKALRGKGYAESIESFLEGIDCPEGEASQLPSLLKRLASPAPAPAPFFKSGEVESSLTRSQFEEMVRAGIRQCREGVVEQLAACQQLLWARNRLLQQQFKGETLPCRVAGIGGGQRQSHGWRTRCGLPQLVGGQRCPSTCLDSNP